MTVVEDAFSAMVDQFKDPLAFLRELIQNALDAGSTTIDVAVRTDGGSGAEGRPLVTLEVQDTGDGMDREIIETKLTRLFASDKDGDATKIGKFGVGFSSTFSIRPEAVVVDTARGNERWRVVFSPDGTWKLYTLDEPIEGTRVRVLKRVAHRQEAAQLAIDARHTVGKWCRYADAQIFFNGAPIAEPFGLPCAVVVRVPGRAPGDELVVGLGGGSGMPFKDGAPTTTWGFYNKGLTLLEGIGEMPPAPHWVSFRVRDGALEHTITRDNVIRDDAFERVMVAIHQAAAGPLVDAALDALEKHVLPEAELHFLRAALVPVMAAGLLDKPAARAKRKIFRDARGGGRSLADVRAAVKAKAIARVDAPGPLADALEKAGALVLRAASGSAEGVLLELAGAPRELAHESHIAIVAAAEREQWDAAPLLASVKTLLAAAPALARIGDVIVARIDDSTGDLTQAPALVVADAALPVPRATATSMASVAARSKSSRMGSRKGAAGETLVLNLACPAIADALALAGSDVWLASFLALRVALPPVAVADGALAMAAWQARVPS